MGYDWQEIFKGKTDEELCEICEGRNSYIPQDTIGLAIEELKQRNFDVEKISHYQKKMLKKDENIEKKIEERIKSANKLKSSANWFYWIFAFSLINSFIIVVFNGNMNFVIGLGITQFVDGVSLFFYKNNPNIITKIFSMLINVFLSSVFLLIGYFARKSSKVSFIIGMIIYFLDGLIFLWIKDFISFGFHVFVLMSIFSGFLEIDALKKVENLRG